jgi:hypothetical protein
VVADCHGSHHGGKLWHDITGSCTGRTCQVLCHWKLWCGHCSNLEPGKRMSYIKRPCDIRLDRNILHNVVHKITNSTVWTLQLSIPLCYLSTW